MLVMPLYMLRTMLMLMRLLSYLRNRHRTPMPERMTRDNGVCIDSDA